MKKVQILILLLCSSRVFAQTATEIDTFNTTEAVMVDSAFGSLDTNRISTKYLLERVPVNFGVNHFNGLAGDSDSIKNTFAFYSVYSSVYLAEVSGNPHFTDPLTFARHADSICKTYQDSIVPVMMFMGEYNSIDSNAYSLGWITRLNPYSAELLDPELPNIPYDTFGVFAAMSDQQKIYGTVGHFYFRFSSDFFAANIPADAGGTLTVDFGDGAGRLDLFSLS